jgi:regulator of protease activity HflC (stomatin/prohibitin superfamily)
VAEGNKEAVILEAEGQKQSAIRHAEGQSESIRLVQQATADGIRMLNESDPTQKILALKSLDAFVKAADGKATKIIIPSEIQGLAGLATGISEVLKNQQE